MTDVQKWSHGAAASNGTRRTQVGPNGQHGNTTGCSNKKKIVIGFVVIVVILCVVGAIVGGVLGSRAAADNNGNSGSGRSPVPLGNMAILTTPTTPTAAAFPSVIGWIVIQQRVNMKSEWSRNWVEYRDGFGTPGSDYWLGLEQMHRMTAGDNATTCRLRIELQDSNTGRWYAVEYSTFSVGNETSKYRLSVDGLGGDTEVLRDPLLVTHTENETEEYHNGMKFSTFDNENDASTYIPCPQNLEGGWWFNTCYYFCPTCSADCNDIGSTNGVKFFYWRATRMLIKTTSG